MHNNATQAILESKRKLLITVLLSGDVRSIQSYHRRLTAAVLKRTLDIV